MPAMDSAAIDVKHNYTLSRMQNASKIRAKFGQRLREARKQRGLDQEHVAQRVGLQSSAISHFELGRRMPSIETLMELADALSISPGLLLGLEPDLELAGPAAARLAAVIDKLSEKDLETVIVLAEHLAKA